MNFDAGQIVAQRLSTGERRVVIEGGFYPRWLSSGHLLYARGGGLFVAPFDADALEITGDPREIVSGVMQSGGAAHYSVSREGTLVYLSGGLTGGLSEKMLVSVDREGVETVLPIASNEYAAASVAPDGLRVVLELGRVENFDVWISDIARGTLSRLTTDIGLFNNPIWNKDGSVKQ